ncbi:MJK13.9 protein [Citrus sinensis]|uniref:MJK13.9 protein n=1 Tax=Citrus sinensis TaxID=2711 RepID=A0ACB8NYH2_CITSI|nr:MJK13.9 protein [Citrus sinensis]
MADRYRLFSIEELPSHLIFEILTSGRLSAVDLAHLELTSKTFGGSHGLYPQKFRSLVDLAASQLCALHSIYAGMSRNVQIELLNRCNGNWKRVLRFLQSVEHSSDIVETSAGNMQITTGRYHTLLISNSSVFSCGSSLCGVLGHGPETTQCVSFTRINFPSAAHVVQVSASENHAAFVLQSGQVFTCGDNSSFCCGHRDTNRPIFRPRLVEALKGVPCKQVTAGLNFTGFLTIRGHVHTCGSNTHGQLGHGDTLDRPTPKSIAPLEEVGSVVQIAAGPSYMLAVTGNGVVYSFGSGSNFCLGHGEQHDELQPRAIQTFRRKGIHVVRVSAGDEHVVALDSSGYVYTWGKGYCGALGHGDEIDKTLPEPLSSLKSHLAVQNNHLIPSNFDLLNISRWIFSSQHKILENVDTIVPNSGFGILLLLAHLVNLRDSASSLKFAPPSFKRTRGAALISYVMTQLRPDKILSALGPNKARISFVFGYPCTPKRILPMEKEFGMELRFNTIFHPQTDGQLRKTIQTLENMLRACVLDLGRVLCFGKKSKLSLRFIGPFEILEKIGTMALPPSLSRLDDVFHVSVLRKYIADPSHILDYQPIRISKDMSYKEQSMEILDKKEQALRKRVRPLAKVCARKRKTFVLVDTGSVYGFGWMGFGSLGFPDRGVSDKVLRPRILDSLRAHHVSQISTGLYHTVVVTDRGRLFGFGDNERAQLGHDTLRGCLEPTEIFIQEMEEDTGLA